MFGTFAVDIANLKPPVMEGLDNLLAVSGILTFLELHFIKFFPRLHVCDILIEFLAEKEAAFFIKQP